jgi:hypothetical protein
MESLRAHLATLRVRMVGSAALYVAFVATAVWMGLSRQLLAEDRMLMWMIPLVMCMLALPTSAKPAVWPRVEEPDEEVEVEQARVFVRRAQSRLTVMRVTYLAGAILLILGLKFGVMPAPTA